MLNKRLLVGLVFLLALGAGYCAASALGAFEPPLEEVSFRPWTASENEPQVGQTLIDFADATLSGSAGGPTVLRMRFVDADANPVQGVRIRIHPGPGEELVSDAAGRISAEVGVTSMAELAFTRVGYANDALARMVPGGELDLGDRVLESGGAISGRVVDEDGAGLAGVRVRVEGRMEEVGTSGFTRMIQSTRLGAAEAISGADGSFRLDGVLPGEVIVIAESGDQLHQGRSGRVPIRAGQRSTGLVITAPRVPDERILEGVVLDPDGNPVARAAIRVSYGWLWKTFTGAATGADGRFRIVLDEAAVVGLEVRGGQGGWNPVVMEGVSSGSLDLRLSFQRR